ncbi:MAG: DUF2157 domain-containing protein [Pseudomonadota bacterium]
MSARKIEIWHSAGLIDADTRAALLAFEEEHSRPLALWAVFGIGALAIGLGLISVVAANWEEVPGQVRLGLHLMVLGGVLGAVFVKEQSLADASPWALEAMAAIAGALGLTFFGHLGQVYQTSSPLWVPIGLWLALFGPALLMTGRGWLSASFVMGAAIYCAWDYAASASFIRFDETGPEAPHVWIAAITAAPVLFAPVAAYLRARSSRPEFWRYLEQLALVYAVVGASLCAAVASADGFRGEESGPLSAAAMAMRAAIGLVAGGLVAFVRPTLSGRMAGAIFAGAALTMLLARAVDGVELAAALLFMALWLGIAAAALKAGWRAVFQLAVAVIALRLIVLSFELASDLLLSGFGLIVSGLLILGVAWAAFRVSREFAPLNSDDGSDKASPQDAS